MIGVPCCRDRWSEIIPGLFMGGHTYIRQGVELAQVVVDREFDLVLSFHQKYGCGPAVGVRRHYAVIPDGPYLTPEQISTVQDFAADGAREIGAGRKVLARCAAGYNRSGLLAGFILTRLGYPAEDSVQLIRRRRSRHALCNAYFVDLIHADEREFSRSRDATRAHGLQVLRDTGHLDTPAGDR